ncbi:hypothetical protein AB4254_11430 [Vibrio breoganii]
MDADIRALTWPQVIRVFGTHEKRQVKDGGCVMPVKMLDGAKRQPQRKYRAESQKWTESYRVDSNVESVSLAFFDLDEPGALDDALNVFKEFEYVMYSTYSYNSENTHKMRIVLKLDESLSPEDWKEFSYNIAQTMDLDMACKNPSRNYQLPSTPLDCDVEPFVKHNTGTVITLDHVKELAKRYPKARTPAQKEVVDRSFGKLAPVSEKAAVHDFSGNMESLVGDRELVSYDYNDMVQLFSNQCMALGETDGRHVFARDVIHKAVMRDGMSSDWYNIIQFMHKVTLDVGTKHLHRGNTPSEIFDLLQNALVKKGGVDEKELGAYFEALAPKVSEALKAAAKSMESGNWAFNKNFIKEMIQKPFDLPEEFAAEEIDKRNRKHLLVLLRDLDPMGYICDVMQAEALTFGSDVRHNLVTQFAVGTAIKTLGGGAESRAEVLESIQALVDTPSEIMGGAEMPIKAQVEQTKFFKNALVLASKCVLNERAWDLVSKKAQRSKTAEVGCDHAK